MSRVFIGLGSNEGDRLTMLSRAAQALRNTEGIRVVQRATIIESEPVGGPPQEPYLNTVIELDTRLGPRELLSVLKDIEQRLGRQPSGERWGPRPIDLDILCMDDRVVQEPDLTIPHPRLHERWFVLEPFAQLAPEFLHPTWQRTIAELLAGLPARAPSA